MRRLNNKGISPVIATVILVAVAIAIAIAVAFWMTGIIGLFTRFEKLEVSYCYAEYSDSKWTIYVKVRNTGTADATISNIFVNGKPFSSWTAISTGGVSIVGGTTFDPANGYALSAGSEVSFTITISEGNEFKHGMSVEVKIVTASGQEYPKLTNLP